MGKSRVDNKNKVVNIETLCLECGKNGFASSKLVGHNYYDIYEDDCYDCQKRTLHIKCKSLDELKAKLLFKLDITEEEQNILNLLDSKKEKVR